MFFKMQNIVQTLLIIHPYYQEIFGRAMWRNVVVEMSYWGHKNKDYCTRLDNYDPDLTEEVQIEEIQSKVRPGSIANTNYYC